MISEDSYRRGVSSSIFVLDLSIEGWAGTLTYCDLLQGSFFLDFLLGFVEGLRVLGEELHCDLGGVLDLVADLPLGDTEVDVAILQDVDCCIEELGVKKMTVEDNGGKAHAASQTGSLALSLLDVLHVLLLVQSSLLTDGAQLCNVAILGSQLTMAADDSVSDFSWEVNLVIEYEIGVRVGHCTDEGIELLPEVVAGLLGHLRREMVN